MALIWTARRHCCYNERELQTKNIGMGARVYYARVGADVL